MIGASHSQVASTTHPILYAINLSSSIISQFQSTGIGIDRVGANVILAFEHSGAHCCCVFEGALQPRLLDASHFYVALGSGKLSADPFLRFLVDTFCVGGKQPTVREGVFLATWAVQHVIDTNPGGVAGPIRIATFDQDGLGCFQAQTLPDEEIAEHQEAIESAAAALRTWRDRLQSGEAAENAPSLPDTPASN